MRSSNHKILNHPTIHFICNRFSKETISCHIHFKSFHLLQSRIAFDQELHRKGAHKAIDAFSRDVGFGSANGTVKARFPFSCSQDTFKTRRAEDMSTLWKRFWVFKHFKTNGAGYVFPWHLYLYTRVPSLRHNEGRFTWFFCAIDLKWSRVFEVFTISIQSE